MNWYSRFSDKIISSEMFNVKTRQACFPVSKNSSFEFYAKEVRLLYKERPIVRVGQGSGQTPVLFLPDMPASDINEVKQVWAKLLPVTIKTHKNSGLKFVYWRQKDPRAEGTLIRAVQFSCVAYLDFLIETAPTEEEIAKFNSDKARRYYLEKCLAEDTDSDGRRA